MGEEKAIGRRARDAGRRNARGWQWHVHATRDMARVSPVGAGSAHRAALTSTLLDLVLVPDPSRFPSHPPLMSSVSRFRAVLSSAFSSRGLPNGEQEFFEELMAHRPQLVNLYDVGPRNPQEQRELESGM